MEIENIPIRFQNMVRTEFNHQTGILNSKFEGDVNINEIVDYVIATRENKSYPRILKILTDATTANMDFTPRDLTLIVEENYRSLEKYDFIIDAILLKSPKETALSILYQELAKTNKYIFQVFSTKEAAVKWLQSVELPSTNNNEE